MNQVSLPKHIAIIMDGNGRWAKLRQKPRTFGHLKGTRVAKKIITACREKGIESLTLYAFSAENWLRPSSEVSFLMTILKRYLKREVGALIKNNIRFRAIGDLSKLSQDVFETIQFVTEETKECSAMQLTFALSYGGRQEITAAVKSIAQDIADGALDPSDISEATIDARIWSRPTPDPDLVIRTSGEERISNFLLWQIAYSEFYFTQTLWPDFTIYDLDLALAQFMGRERRFGGLNQETHANSRH